MRILHVTAQKPFSTGSGTYLCSLMDSLKCEGVEQALIYGTQKGEELPQSFLTAAEGTSCYPVFYGTEEMPFPVIGMSDVMPYPSTRYRDLTEEQWQRFQKAFLRQLNRAVEQFKPDVILSQHLFVLTALIREHFPEIRLYGICHETCLIQTENNSHLKPYLKKYLPRMEGLLALHDHQKKRIEKLYPESSLRLDVIGTGYDETYFHTSRPLTRKVSPDEPIRLIYAGKIGFLKGIHALLSALQKLDENFSLTLIGDSSSPEELSAIEVLIKSAPCPVKRYPRLPVEELLPLYDTHHLFVLPSFMEGIPLVILEALASGLAALMNDLPGIRAWLEDHLPCQSGLQFVPMDSIHIPSSHYENIPEGYEERLLHTLQGMMNSLRHEGLSLPDVRPLGRHHLAKRLIQLIQSS